MKEENRNKIYELTSQKIYGRKQLYIQILQSILIDCDAYMDEDDSVIPEFIELLDRDLPELGAELIEAFHELIGEEEDEA